MFVQFGTEQFVQFGLLSLMEVWHLSWVNSTTELQMVFGSKKSDPPDTFWGKIHIFDDA